MSRTGNYAARYAWRYVVNIVTLLVLAGVVMLMCSGCSPPPSAPPERGPIQVPPKRPEPPRIPPESTHRVPRV